jgi:hypothetical protein
MGIMCKVVTIDYLESGCVEEIETVGEKEEREMKIRSRKEEGKEEKKERKIEGQTK